MTRNRETTGVAAGGTSPTTVGFDRRVLLRRGVILGAGLAGAGALAQLGGVAQGAATPGAAPGARPEITAAANALLESLGKS